ncbi:MAG: DUF3786 domain-containing protein [Candidatus Latescibacteria bacterium]|jgi:hypothetical protein|nr:DUF3786 domain-containing protein [Candidatus Latescibacterota bacterium]
MACQGEKQAWDILTKIDHQVVQSNADVFFNHEKATYEMTCFGQCIYISLYDRNIYGKSHLGKFLINELGEISRLSILRYLIQAKDVSLSGKLVRPSDLPGGAIFIKGTHVLPLDRIIKRFDNNSEDFYSKGKEVGSTQLDYGDMSLKLFVFPRVPLVFIVWSGNEEFPSNCSLLFDSSCTLHLATDIIWSTAMMSVEILLS